MPTTTKSVTGVRYIWEGDRIINILRLDRTYTRDNRGRFASGGGGGGSSGGGKKGGGKKGGGGGSGLTSMKASELQKVAADEGIDINTLSHKRRKSVLAAAIEAKRKGKDLREEGLLKAQKPQSSLAKKRSQSKGKGKKEESISDRVKQVKAANKKSRKSAKPKGKKPNLNGSQDDFEDTAFQVMADLSAKHDKNPNKTELTATKREGEMILSQKDGVFLPIYQVRRAMGEDVSRKEFNDRLLEMQSKGKIQLTGGEVNYVKGSEVQDSINPAIGRTRFFIKLNPEGQKDFEKAKNNPKTDASKYKRPSVKELESEKRRKSIVDKQIARLVPKNADLKSEQGFQDAAIKVMNGAKEEFNTGNIVPIDTIRKAMGDKVTDAEFNQKLLSLGDKGYSFSKGADNGYNLKTPLGTERNIIYKDS